MLLPLSQIPELSPNRQALPLVEAIIARREQLRVGVSQIAGANFIDCGIREEGSLEAGILFSRVCLGGLADVSLRWMDFSGLRLPAVDVSTDHPVRACMASQYAGWPLKSGHHLYMGSGPACAIVCRGSLFRILGYEDRSDTAILCLESSTLPTEDLVQQVIEACGCRPENIYILAARTISLVGTVQVAARALETALFKMRRMGYDLGRIVSGSAICPVSPVAGDTLHGLGRTNDAISYGSTVQLHLQDEDEELARIVGRIPAWAAPEYGQSFSEIRQKHDNFFNLSPDQFNPGEIWLSNLQSGNTFHAGAIRPDILVRSFSVSTTAAPAGVTP